MVIFKSYVTNYQMVEEKNRRSASGRPPCSTDVFFRQLSEKWDCSIQWPFQGPKLEVPTIGAYWIDVLRNPINFIHQPPAPCRNQSFFGCLSLEHAGNFEYLCIKHVKTTAGCN